MHNQENGKNMNNVSSSIIRILSVSTFLLLFLASAFSIPGTLLWEVKSGFRDGGGMVEVTAMVVTENITSEGGVFAYSADTGPRRRIECSSRHPHFATGLACCATHVPS